MNDPFHVLADNALGLLGVEGTALLSLLLALSLVCRLITKLIPDDLKGLLNTIRIITGVLGLYASNRLSAGVKQKDAVRQIGRIAREADNKVDAVSQSLDGTFITRRNPETGKFEQVKLKSPWIVGVVAGLLMLLASCTTTQRRNVVEAICANAPTVQLVLEGARSTGFIDAVRKAVNYVNDNCPTLLAVLDLTPAERQLINH